MTEKVGKCSRKVAMSSTDIATTVPVITAIARVIVGLKMSIVVGGVNLIDRIGRSCLVGTKKCSESGGGGRNPVNKTLLSATTMTTLVLVEGPSR